VCRYEEDMIQNNPQISIILPTYNESQNIVNILKLIRENIPKGIYTETIVVDDNSPDGTGKIVEDYILGIKKIAENTIDIIHRKAKNGLSSAILNGIQNAKGDTIVIMDSDLSHPPQIIPKMIEAFKQYQCDLVVASRYITGGNIQGWTTKRKIMSKIATVIAKKGLGVKTKDPMSGFFAFKKNIIKGLNFDALGYKFLLEILVKSKDINVKEIPYTFENRKFGSSKLDSSIVINYFKSVWKLYKNGERKTADEKRNSIRFLSKTARFFTVGTSGFVVNYVISMLFTSSLTEMWYLHANILGIIVSMSTNFLLNKVWTFEDKDFSRKKTFSQFGKFSMFSSLGALVQLGIVFLLVDSYDIVYPLALISAIGVAAFSNFILNKKLTFKEKLWN